MTLWDGEQREWLQAMGYSLLALAGDAVEPQPDAVPGRPVSADGAATDTADVAGVDAVEMDHSPAPNAVPPAPTPRPPRAPPPRPDGLGERDPAPPQRPRTDVADKAAALDAARRAGAARQFDGPLWDDLLRATRQSPALAARTLREFGVDPAALRDDPQAKRELWIRLRGLRQGGGR